MTFSHVIDALPFTFMLLFCPYKQYWQSLLVCNKDIIKITFFLLPKIKKQ